MNNSVEETRRELFHRWVDAKTKEREMRGLDEFTSWEITIMYGAFNAALDAVVIELPDYDANIKRSIVLDECLTAIESTNLGIKIK